MHKKQKHPSFDISNKKLLIVEDDAGLMYLLANELSRMGYNVFKSPLGKDAIQIIKDENPDLCLIDFKLPDFDAKAIILQLQEENIDFSFIIMTGYVDVNLAIDMMKLGALDFIIKEGNFIELLPNVLQRVFEKRYTQQKLEKTEKDLHATNQLLTSLITASPLAIIALDLNAHITLWSPSAEKIFGWSESDIKGHPIPFYSDNDKNSFFKNFNNLIKGESIMGREISCRLMNDKLLDIRLSTAPILDDNQKVLGVMGIVEDISENKQTRAALHDSERRYRLLAENITDMIWTADLDFKFTYVSPSVKLMLGYTVDDFIRLNPKELFTPDSYKLIIRHFKKSIMEISEHLYNDSEHFSSVFEIEMIANDGKKIWTEIKINHLFDFNKKLIGILAVTREISQRKLMEMEKNKIHMQLLQAQKMEAVGILAGGVAHDFNNVITTINGNVELCEKKLEPSNPVLMYLKQIKNAVKSAMNLTRQLKLFSRKQSLEMKIININDVIKNIIEILNRVIGEDIVINMHLDDDIWSVRADVGNFEQVFMNLTINSRDAMPEGGFIKIITKNVELTETDCTKYSFLFPGSYVLISVSDTGCGIEEKDKNHIFEPFFTTKSSEMGTGLGLAVVYSIVKQHQGVILVESELKKGSTFNIYLPALPVAPDEDIVEHINFDMLHGDGERILIVEDEKGVRDYVLKLLAESGYTPIIAKDYTEAKDICDKINYQIEMVFCDVVLPDKNGIYLVKELRKIKKNLKVIYTSGYPESKNKILSQNDSKEDTFLQKPYSTYQLLSTIKNTLKPDTEN